MRRWICFLSLACVLASFWGVSEARINPAKLEDLETSKSPVMKLTATVTDSFFNDLTVGALWFPSISNKGYIGYWDLSAYYPGGGDQSLVWQAGMWAGGYVHTGTGFTGKAWRYLGSDGDASDPAQYDTNDEQAIVETEADVTPALPYPYRRLTIHVNTALKDFEISEGDTVDGDMGMDVTYEWHQWGVREYDNWVFVHVTIAFTKAIKDFWWGWMSDCDVGDVGTPDPYFDDYAGWDETHKFCYMRDWDYDPLFIQPAVPTTADSLWLSPSIVGQILLAAPPVGGPITANPDTAQKWVSKNYWDWNNDVSSVQNQYDRLAGDWENRFPPEDDFDYRILNGVGPYQVSAGDTAHFWMAYVAGEGYDDDSYETFDMGTLVEHVQDAQAFYNGGMVIPASAYPPQTPDLSPDLAADIKAPYITLHWDPYVNLPSPGAQADSFRVYISTFSKMGPWTRKAAFGSGTTTTDLDLSPPGFYTYIWVDAYSNATNKGSNPWALSSRIYERDENGILRGNENTIVGVIGKTGSLSLVDSVTVAPNPYVASNPGELREYETLIGFHHLPDKCTIYIYTLLGNPVDIMHHDEASGSEFWDMTTRSGEAISSGLYIYRVRAENGEEKIGKFAVIKGQR